MIAQTGWADDRMRQAYDTVWEAWREHKRPDDDLPELKRILVAIEAADHELAAILKEREDEYQ
jgi:hypothetical protein